jgi:hypothetical protein
MSNILKSIYLVSLILYSLCTDCSTLQKADCQAASTECTYSETAATCQGTGCTVVTGTTTCQTSDGCSFTDPADTSTCTGTDCSLSGTACVKTAGCTYVAPVGTCSAKAVDQDPNEGDEVTSPTTFTTTTIKLTSVSGKNVVLSITPVEAEKNYKTTSKASITGLSLTDGDQFTESLTCEIPSGSKLSSVTCTIKNAATDGNKYKLSGTATITSTGNDVFGTATPDTNSEVTASTQNDAPESGSNSHYLQFSFIIFMFLFLY